jgi:hypothetical protein
MKFVRTSSRCHSFGLKLPRVWLPDLPFNGRPAAALVCLSTFLMLGDQDGVWGQMLNKQFYACFAKNSRIFRLECSIVCAVYVQLHFNQKNVPWKRKKMILSLRKTRGHLGRQGSKNVKNKSRGLPLHLVVAVEVMVAPFERPKSVLHLFLVCSNLDLGFDLTHSALAVVKLQLLLNLCCQVVVKLQL